MRTLLDTHALLWWLLNDSRLSSRAHGVIGDKENTILASSASAFEIATKHRLGKLPMGSLTPVALGTAVREERMEILPMTFEHSLVAGGLPGPRRDPFDRMLIAQSRVEGVPVVTGDPVFLEYAVQVIW